MSRLGPRTEPSRRLLLTRKRARALSSQQKFWSSDTALLFLAVTFLTSLIQLSYLQSFTITMPRAFVSAWTVEWIPVPPTRIINNEGNSETMKLNKITPPRSGHVAFNLDGRVYVFGGYVEESPEHRYPSNDMWTLRDDQEGWTNEMQPRYEQWTNQPRKRLAAAAATVSIAVGSSYTAVTHRAVLLGGWDSGEVGTGGEILNDIWTYGTSSDVHPGNGVLDSDTRSFEQLELDLGQPTSRLCAVTLDDEATVLIHNHRCIEDVMLLDFSGERSIALQKQPTTGQSPSSRGLHVMARLTGDNSNKVVLFGGAAQSGDMSNEVFVLDCQTWEWTQVDIDIDAATQSPTPRASPCLVTLDDNTCLLFGGASIPTQGGLHGCNDTWLLELDFGSTKTNEGKVTAKWTCLFADDVDSGTSPPGRNAATLTPLSTQNPFGMYKTDDGEDRKSQFFILHGGWYPFRKTYNDDYVLRVRKDG